MLLPSSGPKSERLIRSMKKTLISKRPVNNATKSAYSAVRLSENFNIKKKTVKDINMTLYYTFNVQKKIEIKTM